MVGVAKGGPKPEAEAANSYLDQKDA